MSRFWLLFLLSLIAVPAKATPIVADLSTYRIDIDAGYKGTRMFVFGARSEGGDVIVRVRGPERNFIVRKKEQVMGMWVNREKVRFWGVPDFYALASTKPLTDMENPRLHAQLKLPAATLTELPEHLPKERAQPFARAFLDYQTGRGLYLPETVSVELVGDTLFKTVIAFPNNIPPGAYTVETYLMRSGALVGMQSMPVIVSKAGLDAFISRAAHQYPLLYGLSALLIALSVGYGAGRMFKPF